MCTKNKDIDNDRNKIRRYTRTDLLLTTQFKAHKRQMEDASELASSRAGVVRLRLRSGTVQKVKCLKHAPNTRQAQLDRMESIMTTVSAT